MTGSFGDFQPNRIQGHQPLTQICETFCTSSAPERVGELAKALYARVYRDGGDISTPAAVAEVAAGIGLSGEDVAAGLQDPAVKARLRDEVEAAIDRGVFGSPFLFVDGEPFWGHDRLDQVERWLETGGW